MKRIFQWLCSGILVLASISACAQANPQVQIKTNMGDFTIELYPNKAPITVGNFLSYVKKGFYKDTIFHRVIDGFMVQGGGFTADLQQKPTDGPIQLEARNGLKNDTGMVAMARTNDPNSATAQFFVNVVDNDNLNAPNPDGYGYTVFGKVINGMAVVNKIKEVPTMRLGEFSGVPATPVVIESATQLQ